MKIQEYREEEPRQNSDLLASKANALPEMSHYTGHY